MFFKLFTNLIYSASELSNFTFLVLKIYIVWREYKYIGNVTMRPPLIRNYMDHNSFVRLKKFSLQILSAELAQEAWIAFVRIVFSDELSHIYIWNLSKAFSSEPDEVSLTRVFIFLTNCKDFLIMLPIYVYHSNKHGFNPNQTLKLVFLEFCSTQVMQFLFLSGWAYSASMMSNVPRSTLIVSIVLFLLTLIFTREFLLVDMVIEEQLQPLRDAQILGQLRPFLERMNFEERNVYLYKTEKKELPNAFTVGHKYFNNEKIAISDNIIGQNSYLNQCCTRDEVFSILMHELGHVFHRHILKTCLLELVVSISTTVLFILLHQPAVFVAHGFPGEPPAIISLLVRMDMLLLYNMLSALTFMLYIRHCEYEADLFSFTFSGIHFRQALLKISLIRPADLLTHDPLYSAWNYSHPCLVERLGFLYN